MNLTTIQGGDGQPAEPHWESLYPDAADAAAAHEQWGIAIRELQEAGTLANANGGMIRQLVDFRIVYARSAKHVAEFGALLPPEGKKAKVGQWNPHWSVMRQASGEIRLLEEKLGITPTSRGKAGKVERGKKRVTRADDYLKRPA